MIEELSSEDKAMMAEMKQSDVELGPLVKDDDVAPAEPNLVPVEPEEDKAPVAPVEAPAEPVAPAEKQQRLVPLSELQEERKSRREAQDRLDAILAKLTQEPEQPKKEIPTPEQDPMGNLKAVNEELQELRRFHQEQQNQARNNQAVNSVMQRAIQQEAEFVKETPDYNDAGNFLRNQRQQQLVAMGYDPIAARNAIVQESLQLANSLLAQGKNVAQGIYEIAKSSGYAKKVAPNVADVGDDRIDKIAAGQKANVSLSNANSTQQKTGDLNAKAILAMDDTAFDKFLSKLSKTERQAVLGQ